MGLNLIIDWASNSGPTPVGSAGSVGCAECADGGTLKMSQSQLLSFLFKNCSQWPGFEPKLAMLNTTTVHHQRLDFLAKKFTLLL